ncbi:hypothetical protein NDU88_002972 [Pleurodeles waltl]|uniref:Uncharacterized protein n=1 Tax=Pleurodeles waltl TaxID=8319 RepID=A0AAV7UDV5_PLEWA|nr:hypothetical protein NDU88_002972 [Pleurodeles waltl]
MVLKRFRMVEYHGYIVSVVFYGRATMVLKRFCVIQYNGYFDSVLSDGYSFLGFVYFFSDVSGYYWLSDRLTPRHVLGKFVGGLPLPKG